MLYIKDYYLRIILCFCTNNAFLTNDWVFCWPCSIPNVVDIHAAFQDESFYYIVMELCPGGDLLELLLRDRKAMSERRTAAEVATPLLTTLSRLHALNVIHRDIKLENVFIDSFGRVKLGDFGLTMSMHQEAAISPVGTVEYMAPGAQQNHQIWCSLVQTILSAMSIVTFFPRSWWFKRTSRSPFFGLAEVVALPPVEAVTSGRVRACTIPPTNEKVDIWALGVTLYELVTGRLPFEGKDKAEIKASISAYKLVAFPSYVSTHCQSMIGAMLAYDPADRPSAEQLLRHPYIQTHCRNTTEGRMLSLEVRAGPARAPSATGFQGSAVVASYENIQPSGLAGIGTFPGHMSETSREVSAHNLVGTSNASSCRDPRVTEAAKRASAAVAATRKSASSGAWAALRRLSVGQRTGPEDSTGNTRAHLQTSNSASLSSGRNSPEDGNQSKSSGTTFKGAIRRLLSRQSFPHMHQHQHHEHDHAHGINLGHAGEGAPMNAAPRTHLAAPWRFDDLITQRWSEFFLLLAAASGSGILAVPGIARRTAGVRFICFFSCLLNILTV
jgi:serine/threonine protein kinase